MPSTTSLINNASIVHFITENEGIIINSVYELIQNGNEPIEQLKHFEVSETNKELATMQGTRGKKKLT